MLKKIYSMYATDWKMKPFPGCAANIRWGLYGCYGTVLGMFLGKDPLELMTENPQGWDTQGNMKSDEILKKYGYKLERYPLKEGQPIPETGQPIILRTSFFKQRNPVTGALLSGYRMSFPTHFFWYIGNGKIVDPATSNTQVTDDVKGYLKYCNEYRKIVKI